MPRTYTRVPHLETPVTVEFKHGRGRAILGVLRRQGQILYRDPIQRGTERRNVIDDLTGAPKRAVSDCQELLERLPSLVAERIR